MTTEASAKLYEDQHVHAWEGKGWAVHNPLSKPVNELPVIYGFNNGGRQDWLDACLIAEDGTPLGRHVCSFEGYMPHDLGVIEGARPDRHEHFKKHYPDGYRMEFVGYKDVRSHAKLMEAIVIADGMNIKKDQVYIGPQGQKATVIRETDTSVTLTITVEGHGDAHEWTTTRRNFKAKWKPFVSECE